MLIEDESRDMLHIAANSLCTTSWPDMSDMWGCEGPFRVKEDNPFDFDQDLTYEGPCEASCAVADVASADAGGSDDDDDSAAGGGMAVVPCETQPDFRSLIDDYFTDSALHVNAEDARIVFDMNSRRLSKLWNEFDEYRLRVPKALEIRARDKATAMFTSICTDRRVRGGTVAYMTYPWLRVSPIAFTASADDAATNIPVLLFAQTTTCANLLTVGQLVVSQLAMMITATPMCTVVSVNYGKPMCCPISVHRVYADSKYTGDAFKYFVMFFTSALAKTAAPLGRPNMPKLKHSAIRTEMVFNSIINIQ